MISSRRIFLFVFGVLVVGLACPSGVLAQHNSSIVVSGTSTNTGNFVIGSTGTNNSLQVSASGVVTTTGIGVIGLGATASNNFFTVSGNGSSWGISSYLEIGENGPSNQGTISSGGSVSVGGAFWVGYANSGNTLTITSGGSLTNSSSVFLGDLAAAGNNAATVTGVGSIWKSFGTLNVGFNGSASQLTISSGGELNTLNLIGGFSAGSLSNLIVVTGANSKVNASGYIEVGENGSANTMIISDHAGVTSGAGGFWVGFNGDSNQFTISTGGSLTNTSLAKIGDTLSSDGNQATVTGTGSTWTSSGLQVGGSGSGNQLTISSGGQFNTTYLVAGFAGASTNNSIIVTGPGSKVTASSYIEVGEAGSANTMIISNNAEVNSAAGGSWVGFSGDNNQLTVASGGSLSTSAGTQIGGTATADGNRAIITGSDSRWTIGGTFTVGNGGSGNELIITNGASVLVNGTAVAGTTGSGNSIRVHAGSTLESSSLATGTGSGNTISNVGGIYQFLTQNPSIAPGVAGTIAVSNGVISFRNVADADVFAPVVGHGYGLVNMAFSGNNTFRLNNSSNTTLYSAQDYTFGTGQGATNFVGLQMVNGTTLWRSKYVTLAPTGSFLASNTIGTVNSVVTNFGTIAVKNSRMTWSSNIVIHGRYVSDPSTNTFLSDATIGQSGSLAGGSGDLFDFKKSFYINSTNNMAFNLGSSAVMFSGGGMHTNAITGTDYGTNQIGFAQNFAYGELHIGSATDQICFECGNLPTVSSNGLYVGWVDLLGDASLVTNLHAANGINIYYDKTDTRNAYLGALSYQLTDCNFATGGGFLMPVIPEPSSLGLLVLAACAMCYRQSRRA